MPNPTDNSDVREQQPEQDGGSGCADHLAEAENECIIDQDETKGNDVEER